MSTPRSSLTMPKGAIMTVLSHISAMMALQSLHNLHPPANNHVWLWRWLLPRDRVLCLCLSSRRVHCPAGPGCPRPARPRLTLTLFYQTVWMHVSEFLWVNTAVRLLQVRAPGTLKTTVRKHREEGKFGEKSRKVVKIFCKTDVI